MLQGFATAEGTARLRHRFPELAQAGHFRQMDPGLWLSSIGLGTYLGQPDDATDACYIRAITAALHSGINLLDAAINYRHQRSERNIGAALAAMIGSGELQRDEVVVCTKAGYLPLDGAVPENPRDYLISEYIQSGIVKPGEAVNAHCMSAAYLADQIERSRRNLGLATIDVFYLHNPETQLSLLDRAEFRDRLKQAIAALEAAVEAGRIRHYGIATWSGLRVDTAQREYISLFDTLEMAREIAGEQHHFRFVQLPFNLAMPEAFAYHNQVWKRQKVSVLELAERAGLVVVGSAALSQGQLAAGLSEEMRAHMGAESDAETAIQFARSAPGLTTTLVGMSQQEHVEANLRAAKKPALPAEHWKKLFRTA